MSEQEHSLGCPWSLLGEGYINSPEIHFPEKVRAKAYEI